MAARAAVALLRLSLLQLLARAHAGATAEALLAEGRLRHGNGERGRFALSTGAWFISPEEKLRRTQNCSLARKEHCTYKLDLGLARCLSRFFAGSTVTELGAGVGRYAQFIGAHNDTAVTAYDGMPDVEAQTEGRVGYRDLSVVHCSGPQALAQSAWAMTLEVAEHIPKQFEAAFLSNIDCANTRGVVLSWSVVGLKHGGIGHVNPRSYKRTGKLFESRGYTTDLVATRRLRRCATKSYFRNGLFVFRRNASVAANGS